MQRNNLVEPLVRAEYRQTDFPENSRKASVSWSLSTMMGKNTEGARLPSSITLSRGEQLRSGANMNMSINLKTNGYDDLTSRGNGIFLLNKRWNGTVSYNTPRRGAWRKSLSINLFQEGYEDWAAGINGNITWYPSEKLNFDFRLNPKWSRDWLIWMKKTSSADFLGVR